MKPMALVSGDVLSSSTSADTKAFFALRRKVTKAYSIPSLVVNRMSCCENGGGSQAHLGKLLLRSKIGRFCMLDRRCADAPKISVPTVDPGGRYVATMLHRH